MTTTAVAAKSELSALILLGRALRRTYNYDVVRAIEATAAAVSDHGRTNGISNEDLFRAFAEGVSEHPEVVASRDDLAVCYHLAHALPLIGRDMDVRSIVALADAVEASVESVKARGGTLEEVQEVTRPVAETW
ncbi:hypothetical protein [Nocardia cyriacigeorgica]|uniref:hypothetical protein n=1 Tax=Nocardia cyriacigeorgica TaxID=135487 RepID=UPI001894D8E6|nr:hypothetical protein [Nocardia cyriacigeorgica]MBF6416975.1 hypothetical protein [Nocardia cyriacigeorgica]